MHEKYSAQSLAHSKPTAHAGLLVQEARLLRTGWETKAWIIIVRKWCLSHDCYGFTLKCWQEQGHLKKG